MNIQKKISTKRTRLIAKLHKIYDELVALKEYCTHPGVIITECSDTDNYCSEDDLHWTEYECPDCGKSWRIDR